MADDTDSPDDGPSSPSFVLSTKARARRRPFVHPSQDHVGVPTRVGQQTCTACHAHWRHSITALQPYPQPEENLAKLREKLFASCEVQHGHLILAKASNGTISVEDSPYKMTPVLLVKLNGKSCDETLPRGDTEVFHQVTGEPRTAHVQPTTSSVATDPRSGEPKGRCESVKMLNVFERKMPRDGRSIGTNTTVGESESRPVDRGGVATREEFRLIAWTEAVVSQHHTGLFQPALNRCTVHATEASEFSGAVSGLVSLNDLVPMHCCSL